MASPAKIVQALPDTLPEDFSEWDGGLAAAAQPVKSNGHRAAENYGPVSHGPVNHVPVNHAPVPTAQVQLPKSQIQVVAVLDGATIAPPFSAASFYATRESISREDQAKNRRNKKRIIVAVASAVAVLVLAILVPTVFPNLLHKVGQSVVHPAGASNGSLAANSSKPSPSTPLTKSSQPVASSVATQPAIQSGATAQASSDADSTTSEAQEAETPQVESKMMNDQLSAPTRIPHDIKSVQKPEAPPAPGFAATSLEGMGNSSGTALGRVFGAGNKGPSVNVVAPTKVSLSSGVAAGMLLKKTLPVYPEIAKAARVSGTVVLQATISITGAIENLHVVTGPVMLQQAALDAVRNWKYRPYQLDGKPVQVETTVNVVFTSVAR